MNGKTATRRRWFRLSLRSALLLTTLACLGLGWYSYRDGQQTRALAEIRALGGNPLIEPGGGTWFSNLLSENLTPPSGRVLAITFLGPAVSDAEIGSVVGHVSVLPDLERITLMDTAITSAGEQRLRDALPHLEIQVIATASGVSSWPKN